MAVLLLAVLQRETHATHDGEPATAVEQDILKVEGTGDESSLKKGRKQIPGSIGNV